MFKLLFLHFACSQSKIITPNKDGEYTIRKVFKKSAVHKCLVNELGRLFDALKTYQDIIMIKKKYLGLLLVTGEVNRLKLLNPFICFMKCLGKFMLRPKAMFRMF